MKRIYLVSIIAILTFLSSCKKDTSIGADILPQDDLLNVKFTDTLTVFSKTLADTFLRTDKLSKNYLGVINDPLFGFQKASIAVELDRPNDVYDDTLMTSYTVDSVVLFLKYSYIYGDTTVPQSFDVSTISNKIIETSPYYSNSSLFPPTGIIGSVSNYLFTPTTNPVATSRTDTVGVKGILRIKINNYVGNTILDLKQTILRDSSLFKNAFPGILIENATNAGKAMAEIDISSGFSALAIFYKDKNGDAKDMKLFTSILNYNTGSNSTRVNGVNLFSNLLSSTVQNVVTSGLVSDSVNYILGQGGTLVKLNLPSLANLGNLAVNKAVLQVSQIVANNPKEYTTPFTLVLLKRDANGLLDILPTITLSSSNTGLQYIASEGAGFIDSIGVDISGNKIVRYNINISKYIQRIVSGNEANSELYLCMYRSGGTDGTFNALNSFGIIRDGQIAQFSYSPYRLIIAGANYSDPRYKLKLNLTYTKIN
jgi:hypothetical protein